MRKWMLISGGACVAAVLLTFAVVHAQQRGTGKLTADDREEIRELIHRYMYALDNCPDGNNGYDYADLYTEDGRFGANGTPGREALARAAGRREDGTCAPQRFRGPQTQIHINVGEVIVPSPEGARGTSYLFMIDGPGGTAYWDGWYEDIYVKTPKGWRFKQRQHVNNERAGIPPAALQHRREMAAASAVMPADPNIPISRNAIKWVDGIDTRAIQDTPSYAPGVGARQGGAGRQGGGGGQRGR